MSSSGDSDQKFETGPNEGQVASTKSNEESKIGEEIKEEPTDVKVFEKSAAVSIGIRRVELLNQQYDKGYLKVILLVSVFCAAYSYSLDGTIRYTFQNYATASYAEAPLISTVNVIKSVVAAAAQPTYARLSDKFGRLELMVISIIFYSMGTVIESQAFDVNRFAGGSVLYQIGYSGMIVLLQIILADFSNLNWRLVSSFVPALPFIINTWISGNVTSEMYPAHSWNYDIGIWAFIFPLTCIPLICCFIHMLLKARKTEEWRILNEEAKTGNKWFTTDVNNNTFVTLFWELDAIGILFIICVFGFILVPLTLAGGISDDWKKASTIAPLVIGFVLIPFFLFWEGKMARFPILPLRLIKDRGVWSALLIGVMIDFIWYMPNDYMYQVLIVGMNASIKAATRITSLYSFVSVIVGPLLGLVIVRFRRLKGFIMFGTACWIVSLGILLHFRGNNDGKSELYKNGVIGGLCFMGFGAGFFTYSTQVSIASCTTHEYMAVIISLYLASYNIGAALGSCVSGAVWTNLMYNQIVKQLTKAGLDTSLATSAYGDPYDFIIEYVWGTPERIAIVLAYAHVQKILCIVGLVLCFPLFCLTFFLRDHRLDSVQSLEFENSSDAGVKDHGHVVLNNYDDDILLNKFKSLFRKKQNA